MSVSQNNIRTFLDELERRKEPIQSEDVVGIEVNVESVVL